MSIPIWPTIVVPTKLGGESESCKQLLFAKKEYESAIMCF